MYYKQPGYFGNFYCTGSECINNCCYGWRINWEQNEIDKILGAENISDELSELVKKSFIPNELVKNQWYINFLDNGSCPFETADGLCRIQKELGAEYLSYICSVYPRVNVYSGKIVYRHCRMSCCEVAKRILNDENCTKLISVSAAADDGKKIITMNALKDIESNPEQRYRTEIFEFFYELISDKSLEAETAIILGGVAAERLSRLVSMLDFDRIPEEIKTLRRELKSSKIVQSTKNIKPQKQIKLGYLSGVTEQIIGAAVTVILHQNNAPDMDLYELGEQRLYKALEGREYFYRNVALQLLLELDVPFKFPNKTIFENYSLFAAAFGCIKLNLIAAMAIEKPISVKYYNRICRYNGDNKIIGLTSLLSRGISQNTEKAEGIINSLNENGLTKPGHLGFLVK